MTEPGSTETLEGDAAAGLTIAAVERDCGIGKDTLRVWERRYGFPRPVRDSRGDRRYPADQLAKLRVLSRMLAAGHRPSRIVGLAMDELEALAAVTRPKRATTLRAAAPNGVEIAACLDVVRSHDAQRLRDLLTARMMRDGLAEFVAGFVAPLTSAVGEAWAAGELQIFEEHLFTEQITRVLRAGIAATPSATGPGRGRPKVLLTTVPGERHALGLLMAEAMFALAGCNCVALGAETPVEAIAQGAEAHGADIIALSFSARLAPAAVTGALRELLAVAPRAEVWAGGASPALKRPTPAGVRPTPSLKALAGEVEAWRRRHGA